MMREDRGPGTLIKLLLLVACCWLGGGGRAGAVEVIAGPTVEVLPAERAAVIRWTTDVECGRRVKYGFWQDRLDQKAGEGVGTNHEVKLTDLAPGTCYYTVGTARKVLVTGQFTMREAAGKGGPLTGEKTPPVAEGKRRETPLRAPPASATWGNLETLEDHFDRHGRDVGARTPEDYARLAWEFLQRAMDEGLPAKQDPDDGTLRVYDAKTGAFAAYNRNGTTKTYFKPESPGYWGRQPGRPVRLKRK